MQEAAFALTPSPNLSPKGGEEYERDGDPHMITTPASVGMENDAR
jgi:hypothetical protein